MEVSRLPEVSDAGNEFGPRTRPRDSLRYAGATIERSVLVAVYASSE